MVDLPKLPPAATVLIGLFAVFLGLVTVAFGVEDPSTMDMVLFILIVGYGTINFGRIGVVKDKLSENTDP